LNDVVSSNANGINAGYRYDEANRLVTVDDGTTGTVKTTSFTYNANGSLETLTQPNTVVHTYNYDALNRLRGLIVSRVPTSGGAPTIFHTYEYKLNPSGHRRRVIEGTRTTTYDYDALYRLTNETIAGDAHNNNGSIGYTLDKVGNRLSRSSQMSAISDQSNLSYDVRDRLTTDTYDANGNTLVGQLSALSAQLAGTDVYDFENRLILRTKSDGTSVNISYDSDGNRIQKNLLDANGTPTSATTYLVDSNNLTGYAQVVEERVSVPTGVTLKVYTYGNQLLSCATALNNQPAVLSYYAFDGHGNVRELTDAAGSVTDRYDYDAFGKLIFTSGGTTNVYQYCGEQFDADLGLYYLRARYLNPDSSRFWSMDSAEPSRRDPSTLHRYLYCGAQPVSRIDPSGNFSLVEAVATVAVVGTLNALLRPVVQQAVGSVFSFLGFVPGQKVSLTSLGVDGDSPAILEDLGVGVNSTFSDNLFVAAAEHLATDVTTNAMAAVGGQFAIGAFAKAYARRVGTNVTDYSYQLSGEWQSVRGASSAGANDAGHHVIPWALRTSALIQKAARGGFNFHGTENAMALPKSFHNSGHPQYNSLVQQTLTTYEAAFPNASPTEAAALVKNLATELKSYIINLQLTSPTLR
jgi:RHS repeat-associated protein